LHIRLRVHQAPGIPCALIPEGKEFSGTPRTHRAAGTQARICNYNDGAGFLNQVKGAPPPVDFAQVQQAHFRRKARMGGMSTD
jgi:hypothetical protein